MAEISRIKGEPEWMTKLRLKAYRHFESRPLPTWGGDMTGIDFQDIYYYVTGTGKSVQSWDDVPDYIRRTYDRWGSRRRRRSTWPASAGSTTRRSCTTTSARSSRRRASSSWTDQALKEHEDLFRQYFGTIIPANDNKLAALNTAVWSGGSFIYVPKGVHVELPLQAYFRINTENMGQFERTLIIADEGSSVHYVEGCTAQHRQPALGGGRDHRQEGRASATRRSRTGATTSTTSSPSGRWPTRTRSWSGWTATSART